jgi:hypothetical protein
VHGGRLDSGVDLLGKPHRDALARKVRVLADQAIWALAAATGADRASFQ